MRINNFYLFIFNNISHLGASLQSLYNIPAEDLPTGFVKANSNFGCIFCDLPAGFASETNNLEQSNWKALVYPNILKVDPSILMFIAKTASVDDLSDLSSLDQSSIDPVPQLEENVNNAESNTKKLIIEFTPSSLRQFSTR